MTKEYMFLVYRWVKSFQNSGSIFNQKIQAQRLVLNYCSYCEAQGCEKCNFTKYYDRSSIAEVLKIDEKMSSFIFRKASMNEIKEYLISIDFKTILDDGKQKVDLKITSLDEVYKVISY